MKTRANRVLEGLPVENRRALRRVRGCQLRVGFGVATADRDLRALILGR